MWRILHIGGLIARRLGARALPFLIVLSRMLKRVWEDTRSRVGEAPRIRDVHWSPLDCQRSKTRGERPGRSNLKDSETGSVTMDSVDDLSGQVRRCVERIAESGEAALSALYDLTSQRLLRLAATITCNQHDAEDVLQATLVRVAGQPELLVRATNPWPYLLRMVRNEALLLVRRRKSRMLADGLQDLTTYCKVDELEMEETFRAVWAALRRLPVQQSEVVVLKIWEGLTFAQIAEVLELTPSTAASRYRYAMRKLSNSLGHQEEVFHG